jgi:DNA-binding MarR family transcriptional regulator
MSSSRSRSATRAATTERVRLGRALQRAWVGYQQRLDTAMASAGFTDRQFPDARVLRMCRDSPRSISEIGRELGITRQGAHKIVASLRARRYVAVRISHTNRSEKIVELTPRAHEYLAARRRAARRIERQVRVGIGDDAFTALVHLLDSLTSEGQPHMRDYLRTRTRPEP